MRVGLIQLSSSDDPSWNLATIKDLVTRAAEGGAQLALTPEVSNCVSLSRTRQADVLRPEGEDPTLAGVRDLAARLGIGVLIGSLALKTDEARFANRSFLIGPDGGILARYDKIHMFDVTLGSGETYRESDGYRPGETAVVSDFPPTRLGMTICYDLRFPGLYRDLAAAGAQILTIPSAFTVPTGAAHWHVLLRARAIETGCFVLAPAQTGQHPAAQGRSRATYGHSLAVDPWGKVLLDMGTETGVQILDLDLTAVDRARAAIPSLDHGRAYQGPSSDV